MKYSILTDEELRKECFLMPKMIGRLYYRAGFPLPIHSVNYINESYIKYLKWRVKEGKQPNENDFNILHQYLIYYLYAPIWNINDDFQKKKIDVLNIKNFQEMDVFTFSLLDLGIDPF